LAASNKEPSIIVENLTARFGGNTIFQNVAFEVYRGEIFVILGGSGCGKSTLLKHLIGLYEANSGKVVVNGIDITKADEKQLKKVRMDIGVLFQSGGLFG
jgi:phospholipid/cholesterol/gamma-HCH transport system ATP-binding protein